MRKINVFTLRSPLPRCPLSAFPADPFSLSAPPADSQFLWQVYIQDAILSLMDKKIEKLGSFISSYVDSRPSRAASLLAASYRAVGLMAGHFPSKKYAGSREYLQAYTANLLAGLLRDPSGSAVVNIFMPGEIFCALGIPIMAPEALAAYVVNTAAERIFIEKAEENGTSGTFCSFHKVLTGMAEAGIIKKPALIANTSLACDANQLTFRHLAELWQVPHCMIDVPYRIDEEAVQYVAEELRSMEKTAAECAGKTPDPDLLRKCIARSRRQIHNYRKYLELRPLFHLPESLTPEMLNIMANHLYLGSGEGLRYSSLLLEDLGKAAPHTKEKKIIWMHVLPNWQDTVKEIFQGPDNHQIEIIANDLAMSALIPGDPEKPYESMAKRLVYDSFNGPGIRRIKAVYKAAKEMGADGIVIFCQWGCKQTQGLALAAKNYFEERGIPALVLDGDGGDRANGGGEQIITRARAFAELLDHRGQL